MLKITEVKWKHREFNNLTALVNILNTRLKNNNITTKININEQSILFNDIVDGKTFVSSVDNKIIMKASDPRIRKTGRSYLLTKRPTQEQYDAFFNTIQSSLDSLGLYATVELYAKGSNNVILRKGIDKFNTYPPMKSFPIKITEGEVNAKA